MRVSSHILYPSSDRPLGRRQRRLMEMYTDKIDGRNQADLTCKARSLTLCVASICADKFVTAPGAANKRVKLKDAGSCEQDDFIENGGWSELEALEWMGGVVPLGYHAKDRKLLVNAEDAETVRALFERYLDLKSVPALKKEIDRGGFGNKDQIDVAKTRGVGPGVSRGRLYTLLSNPIHIGKLRHRGELHDGGHEAIMPTATFDAAQALLAKQAPQ